MHSPVQIISYYAKPLCYDQHLTYVPASSSVFYHTEYTAKYSVLRAVRNTPCPNAVVCSVWCCCGALRGFWLWWVGVVGRWLGTISKKEKEKCLRENPWGKGWMSPETLKKRMPPHKKGSKETSGSHQFTCCWWRSRCVPKPRCVCRDPLRRAQLRLEWYSKTNLRCAKLSYSD